VNVWVALLRGVNVGGHKKLPMAEFREVLSALGLQNVATYIQSGNAVFRSSAKGADLAKLIGNAVSDSFGFEADVFVLSRENLRSAISKNPYPQAELDPKTLHLFFLQDAETPLNQHELQPFATNQEAVQQIGSVVYLQTPNGFGRSDLATRMPRIIKSPMTGRNLRSCQKIAELANAI
jgi:uncharacterized protein (DUF1697 family)